MFLPSQPQLMCLAVAVLYIIIIITRYTYYMQEMPHAQRTDEGGTLHGAC